MDPESFNDQNITQESNKAYLKQIQGDLHQDPSMDMSEVSYHTENTRFAGSRHSSLNTEPLTLDADQIHDAKGRAADVLEQTSPNSSLDIFTKELEVRSEEAAEQGSQADVLAKQINSLVEKAQQVVEANEKHSQSMGKIPGAPSSATEEQAQAAVKNTKTPLDSTEENVKTNGE